MRATLRITTGRRGDVRRVPNQALHSLLSGDLAIGSDGGPTRRRLAGRGSGSAWWRAGGHRRSTDLDDGAYTEILNGDVQPGDDLIIGEGDNILEKRP